MEMHTTISVDAHLAALPPDRREILQRVRQAIFRIHPEVTERMAAGIPSFFLEDHAFLSIASRKNYIALYIVPHDLLNVFKTDLRQYDHGRSCIRFKRLDPPFFELIQQIVRYTGSQLSTSKFYKPKAGDRLVRTS